MYTGHPPGGKFYCAAIDIFSDTIMSIDKIKLLGESITYSQSSLYRSVEGRVINVLIKNVVPATSYNVYCMGEDSNGNTDTWTVLERLRQSVRTTCCRNIKYLNAPSFVYGEIEAYVDGVDNPKSFVYSYSIQIDPGAIITVYPMLFDLTEALVVATTTISPSSATFENPGAVVGLQTGSYMIRGISGRFIVKLIANSDLYNITAIPVNVISLTADPPAPQLLNAIFDSSGSLLTLNLESNSDQALNYASVLQLQKSPIFNCDRLFVFRSDSITDCTWLSASSIVVRFGSNPDVDYLRIGDTITLKDNRLKAACKKGHTQFRCSAYAFSVADAFSVMQVPALAPTNPVKPSINLQVPAILSGCDDLFIDASGTTGIQNLVYSILIYTCLKCPNNCFIVCFLKRLWWEIMGKYRLDCRVDQFLFKHFCRASSKLSKYTN